MMAKGREDGGGIFSALYSLFSFFFNLGGRLSVLLGFLIVAEWAYRQFQVLSTRSKKFSDLVHWRDVKKSGAVFGATMALLIFIASFSLLTVVSYAGLAALAVAIGFRVYKQVTTKENPYKVYFEKKLDLPRDRLHQQVDVIADRLSSLATELRRLILVEHVVDTVKFAVLLWATTYIGAWFSGMALIIIVFVGAFTLPKFYEIYKEPIDRYYGLVRGHVDQVWRQVEEKVPFLKKKQA